MPQSMNNVHRQTDLEQLAPSGLARLKGFGDAVVDLLFPPRCVTCHRLGAWLCSHCLDEIEVIHPPICYRCGLPVNSTDPGGLAAAICGHCQQAPLQLDGLRAYAFHSGPLRQAIHQFKYEDLRALAAPLGNLMADGWAALSPPAQNIDVVVPVPLHATRHRQRGYNQAALLAREIGARLHWPVVEDILVRARATAPQVELSAQERQANVRDAFRCVDDSLSGRRLLLVDDVCTTGFTLEAACAALQDAGGVLVWAYTLARARGNDRPSVG
jgi:ComF family protein